MDRYKLYKGSVFRVVLLSVLSYINYESRHIIIVIYCIILYATGVEEVTEGNVKQHKHTVAETETSSA